MAPSARSSVVTVGPAAYAAWRATPLGALTERLERALLLRTAGSLVGVRMLDVGSGDGTFGIQAAKRGAIVSAVDPDPAMLAAAAVAARDTGLELRLVNGRAEQLPFRDNAFQLVFAVTVLCFVRDARRAIEEIARVLEPGGVLSVGELNRWSLWAALRRVKGWFGNATWRGAHFRTASQLARFAADAGLTVTAREGAIFFPPSARIARIMERADGWLGRRTTLGAAFVVVAARKRRGGELPS